MSFMLMLFCDSCSTSDIALICRNDGTASGATVGFDTAANDSMDIIVWFSVSAKEVENLDLSCE